MRGVSQKRTTEAANLKQFVIFQTKKNCFFPLFFYKYNNKCLAQQQQQQNRSRNVYGSKLFVLMLLLILLLLFFFYITWKAGSKAKKKHFVKINIKTNYTHTHTPNVND